MNDRSAPRGYRLAQAFAVACCLAVPTGAYALGDAVDAFPGVLTRTTAAPDPDATLPPAAGESLEATAAPLLPDGETPAPVPDGGQLLEAMRPFLTHPVLADGGVSLSVVDVETGQTVLGQGGETPLIPASTVKLLTAAAAYRVLDPAATLDTTTVVDGATVHLVAGGDMLLTTGGPTPDGASDPTPDGASDPTPGGALGRASLRDLARETAAHLTAAGVTGVTVRVDDTVFSGDPIDPDWGGNGPAGGWVAPITGLGVDNGDLGGDAYGPKAADPSLDAGAAFAALLAAEGITVQGDVARAPAPDGAPEVARVSSAPIGDLIGFMLVTSSNTSAEVIGRLVALGSGRDGTSEAASTAVAEVVRGIARDAGGGLPDGFVLVDCSGLSRGNRLPPALLASLLAGTASGDYPSLTPMLTQVPIAALTGTLATRFDSDAAAPAAGIVRGKTGYLGGATSLAGTVTTPEGRVLAFAIIAHGFDPARGAGAQTLVDDMAAVLAGVR